VRTVIAMLALLLCGCAPSEPKTSLLLVTLDTLRADHVGAYGAPPGVTPHLDALAREGLVHEAAYTTMPTTGPAHLSLFTGLPPRRHGTDRNGMPLDPALREREVAVRLRGAGYATAAFVTTRLLDRSVMGLEGFEIYDGTPGALRPGREAAAAALRWLDVERRRPVFLWVHLYDAHAPYGTADEKRRGLPLRASEYGFVDAARFADPTARNERREAYTRGVRDADAALGEVVAGVRARIAGPLLIAVVADHGEALDEWMDSRHYAFDHGEFLDVDQIQIPLVLAGTGVAPGRSAGAVSISDLYGTLLAAAGVAESRPTEAERRDLRLASQALRIVVAERRADDGRDAAPDPRAAAALRAHSVAAMDGRALAVIAEDGTLSQGDARTESLAEAARAALGEFPPRRAGASVDVDPVTRDALRSLGYAP
jgi:arylsulfatase A-like enzyme